MITVSITGRELAGTRLVNSNLVMNLPQTSFSVMYFVTNDVIDGDNVML